MTDLNGQVAIVTGGGTGIGKGVVERLIKEGMSVVINGVDIVSSDDNQYGDRKIGGYQAAIKLASQIKSQGGQAIAYEADVTKAEQMANLVSETVKTYGKLDLLVNSAGVVTSASVVDLTEHDWDAMMTINAKGTFLSNQAVLTQMLKQEKGKIINISSIAGKQGYAGLAHYCASKFAVIGFSQALAKELIQARITVNVVCPGVVSTPMWDMLSEKFAEPGESNSDSFERNVDDFIPQGEPQTVEDMAEAVVFLANSDHVTGQAINVDGGSVM